MTSRSGAGGGRPLPAPVAVKAGRSGSSSGFESKSLIAQTLAEASLLEPSRPVTPGLRRVGSLSSEDNGLSEYQDSDWAMASSSRPGTASSPTPRSAGPFIAPTSPLRTGSAGSSGSSGSLGSVAAVRPRPPSGDSAKPAVAVRASPLLAALPARPGSGSALASVAPTPAAALAPTISAALTASARPSSREKAADKEKDKEKRSSGTRPIAATASAALKSKLSVGEQISALEARVQKKEPPDAVAADAEALLSSVVESRDLVRLCGLLLRLQPARQAQAVTSSCLKRVFALSSDKGQDELLQPLTGSLVAVLADSSRSSDQITAVLAILRNVSIEDAGQKQLADLDAVDAIGELLRPARLSEMKLSADDEAKLLTEATAVLRNLSVLKEASRLFVQRDCLQRLCALMQNYGSNSALMLNVCRILSKLSLHQSCRAVFAQDPSAIKALVTMLATHHTKMPLCVRVCFILGNLTVSNDEHRVTIFKDCDGITVLLAALRRSYERDLKLEKLLQQAQTSTDDKDGKDKESGKEKAAAGDEKKWRSMALENEDLLVKLIRVIANLSINRQYGPALAKHKDISLLARLLQRKDVEICEELVLNLISAITNVSFYNSGATAGAVAAAVSTSTASAAAGGDVENVLFSHKREILACLLPTLFSSNNELLLESIRALGNFSRDAQFRKDMVQARADETMIVLLDHSDPKIVYGVCGVLLNLAADPSVRTGFYGNDGEGLDKMAQTLSRLGTEHLHIADVICKTFLNLCMIAPQSPVLPQPIVESLLPAVDVLCEYLQTEDDTPSTEEAAEEEEQKQAVLQVCLRLLEVLSGKPAAS